MPTPAPSSANEPQGERGDPRRRHHHRFRRRARREMVHLGLVLLAVALFALLLYFGNFLDALP